MAQVFEVRHISCVHAWHLKYRPTIIEACHDLAYIKCTPHHESFRFNHISIVCSNPPFNSDENMQLSILASSITPSILLRIGTNQHPSTPVGISATPSTVCSVCLAHSILCCTTVSHSAQISSFQWSPLEMLGSLQLSCTACAGRPILPTMQHRAQTRMCLHFAFSVFKSAHLTPSINHRAVDQSSTTFIPILNCNFCL